MTSTTMISATANPLVFRLATPAGRFVGRVMAPGHRGRKTWTASRLSGTDKDARRYAMGFASQAAAVAFVEKGVTQ